jgi:hypothetical protein
LGEQFIVRQECGFLIEMNPVRDRKNFVGQNFSVENTGFKTLTGFIKQIRLKCNT